MKMMMKVKISLKIVKIQILMLWMRIYKFCFKNLCSLKILNYVEEYVQCLSLFKKFI